MSIVLVKIKHEENASLLKKFIGILNEKAEIIDDEDYRDAMFSKLLAEGRKSKLLSHSQAKKELKKRGIKV
jgi:flagellar motor switch protein FliG